MAFRPWLVLQDSGCLQPFCWCCLSLVCPLGCCNCSLSDGSLAAFDRKLGAFDSYRLLHLAGVSTGPVVCRVRGSLPTFCATGLVRRLATGAIVAGVTDLAAWDSYQVRATVIMRDRGN